MKKIFLQKIKFQLYRMKIKIIKISNESSKKQCEVNIQEYKIE